MCSLEMSSIFALTFTMSEDLIFKYIWVILPHDTLQSREGALVIICFFASPYRKDDDDAGIILPLQKGELSHEKGTVSQT